jgi:signal transduction histidine kinase/CheY-like chemotaxis protein
LGIQARLIMLASVTALPLVVLASVTSISLVAAQRLELQREVAGKVNGLIDDIDSQIRAIEVELEVLAALPSVQSGDLAAFDQQLRAAIKVYGTGLVLHDTEGQQLINTSQPRGVPLPRATDTTMHHQVVATAKPQVSNLIIGATLHSPIISVGVPVIRDGRVIYVLAMGIVPEVLSELLQAQHLVPEEISPSWTIALLDRDGIIMARNRELGRFLGQPVAPMLRKAMARPVERWIPNVTSEGTPVYSTFRHSPLTGWTVAIGVPREFVDAPVNRAWEVALGGGSLFMTLSLALAWRMAQAIRRPVNELAAMTKSLGTSEPVGPFRGGVRELNLVGDGLRTASAALARHRELLEERVAAQTRELRAEIEARKQAQATLLQSQKMEAIGQLTGGIAHDFNNLLTVAWGSLEMLEARISDEKSLRLLQSAQGAMSSAARLTTALLAFARKQRLEPVPADINSVITEMDEMLRRSLGPSVEIQHRLADDLWPVTIDIGQIETALLNIAINARDAMPDGGTLLIETANVSGSLPEEVGDHDCVLVSVHDAGTGMSPEVMERAFEPFFTTKEAGRGTGLGLSMVFGVIRQSGGAVRLHSRLGSGTTVSIYLPRAEHASRPAARDAALPRVPARTDARILVVDDDAAVRSVTANCLQAIGYSVTEAGSGGDALTLLQSREPCDLVIMDQVMPGLSGEDTVRMARRSRPALKVLFLSGYPRCGEIGDDLWLQKPFSTRNLAEAVSRMLQ